MPKITIEGHADISVPKIVTICGHCNSHESERSVIEFNARDKKIVFSCPKCNQLNEIVFGNNGPPPPLPRTRLG